DPYQRDLVLAALRKVSLVIRQPDTQTFGMHRLVQAVLYDQMESDELLLWSRRAVTAVDAAFPGVAYEAWRQCRRLLPHLLADVSLIPEHACYLELARILQKAADYLSQRAQYQQAKLLYERALYILEQTLETDHLEVADLLNGLANLYASQGEYEQAEALYQR